MDDFIIVHTYKVRAKNEEEANLIVESIEPAKNRTVQVASDMSMLALDCTYEAFVTEIIGLILGGKAISATWLDNQYKTASEK